MRGSRRLRRRGTGHCGRVAAHASSGRQPKTGRRYGRGLPRVRRGRGRAEVLASCASLARRRPTTMTTDLFAEDNPAAPLAERLRPHRLDEVIGQAHLLGPGKPLRVAFESGRPHSMILWGPPGTGKTTLARLMADAFGLEFIAISAVLGGVKDIRDAVERAQA